MARLFSSLSVSLGDFSQKYIPSSFAIALILTLLAFGLGLALTPSNFFTLIQNWGSGFWELLSFGMQMCLMILTGYIVAVSPVVSSILDKLAGLARGPSLQFF